MKTHDLIELLGKQAAPPPRYPAFERFVLAMACGTAMAAMGAILSLGLIPVAMFQNPAPWIKLTYGGVLVLACGLLAARLGRPAVPFKHHASLLAGLMVIMLGLGAYSVFNTPTGIRLTAIAGHSWFICPVAILGLSIPSLLSSFWAMKGLAPTQLRLTGFVCGLFAGAAGSIGYALACTETSTAFIAIWYSLGVLAVGGFGALLGPHVMRW